MSDPDDEYFASFCEIHDSFELAVTEFHKGTSENFQTMVDSVRLDLTRLYRDLPSGVRAFSMIMTIMEQSLWNEPEWDEEKVEAFNSVMSEVCEAGSDLTMDEAFELDDNLENAGFRTFP